MDQLEYQTECELCESTTLITVLDVDEKPNFCPMCGEDLQLD